MVELSEEVVDAMTLVKEALKITKFKINRIELQEDGTGEHMICFDLRKREKTR